MDNSEFKVKMRAESHIDELAEASTRNGRKLTQDKKKHAFAINGFSYRTAYFHDFDGKYYKVTISVGHNGTKATVYNVAQIKEDTLPTANILAVNGSKAVGKYPLKHSISDSGENVNSSSKKSYFVSEADDGMDSDVTAKAVGNCSKMRNWSASYTGDRSDAGGCRVCSEGFQKNKKDDTYVSSFVLS
ncbi:MAG: hypothetical protein ACOYIO_06095 [Eubacteriales bacterium]|jgi:hypothetical protein